MPHSIELRFDEATESEIKTLWDFAADFYCTDYVLRNGIIPHVALLVGNDNLQNVFDELSPPIGDVRLHGLGFFSGGEVAYLHAKIDDQLASYHRLTYDAALQADCAIYEYYVPNQWIPHCTIAQYCTMNKQVTFPVVEILAGIKSLILVEYPPTTLVTEKPKIKPNKSMRRTS